MPSKTPPLTANSSKQVEYHGKGSCDAEGNVPKHALQDAIAKNKLFNPGTRELVLYLAQNKQAPSGLRSQPQVSLCMQALSLRRGGSLHRGSSTSSSKPASVAIGCSHLTADGFAPRVGGHWQSEPQRPLGVLRDDGLCSARASSCSQRAC